MSNDQALKELVDEASDIRIDINKKWKIIHGLKDIYGLFFKVDKSDIKYFKNAYDFIKYLGGGWPSKNSKGRMEEHLDALGHVFRMFSLTKGHDNIINKYLREKYGLELTVIDKQKALFHDYDFSQKEKDGIKKLCEKHLIDVSKLDVTSRVTLLNTMLSLGVEIQNDICKHADIIKLNLAHEAKSECKIYKRNFLETVKLGVKRKTAKAKSFEKLLANTQTEKIDNLITAVAIFK